MAVVMSEDLAADREDVPVVMRLRQYGGAATPARPKASRPQTFRPFKLRTEQLVALSATPLLALVMYIGWQLTATPVAPAMANQPIAVEPPAIRIESTPEPMTRESSHGLSVPVTPTQSPANGIYMPSSDASSFQPTHAARPNGEISEIRSAECWCNENANQTTEGQSVDPNVIRIQSVEAAPTAAQIRGKMRTIPASPE